jgi:hypothetical protein
MIGKIICWWKGHKRGKRIKRVGIGADGNTDTAVFQCPRCSATWTRKAKPTT